MFEKTSRKWRARCRKCQQEEGPAYRLVLQAPTSAAQIERLTLQQFDDVLSMWYDLYDIDVRATHAFMGLADLQPELIPPTKEPGR
jgi:hypothetical protein